jgi:hypothetical protein
VIFKNGQPLAVAAGGGGGGGGANKRDGGTAPGTTGQAAEGISAGQSGQNKNGDGGGGGGGGGGLGGGNGGFAVDGDQGGGAGVNGLSSSPAQNPAGRDPGGRANPYYPGTAGQGGIQASGGNAGAAVLLFQVPGLFVHNGTSFVLANSTWVKVNNEWKESQNIYIKIDGVWRPIGIGPEFVNVNTNFGIAPRPIAADESTSGGFFFPNFEFGGGEFNNGFEGNMGSAQSVSGVGGGTPGDASGDGQASA